MRMKWWTKWRNRTKVVLSVWNYLEEPSNTSCYEWKENQEMREKSNERIQKYTSSEVSAAAVLHSNQYRKPSQTSCVRQNPQ